MINDVLKIQDIQATATFIIDKTSEVKKSGKHINVRKNMKPDYKFDTSNAQYMGNSTEVNWTTLILKH